MGPPPSSRRGVEIGVALRARPSIALVGLALATLAGNALAGSRWDACEDRCDERYVECESSAEAKADECTRGVAEDDAWIECDCGGIRGTGERCVGVCTKSDRAVEKCKAKLERRLDRCFDKQARCLDRCED